MVQTPKPPRIEIQTGDGYALELRHHPGTSGARPVLLVHGASASSDTFRIGERQTFVDFLLRDGCDVWTLDWRAGMFCARGVYCASVAAGKPMPFTIDDSARFDVPAALAQMRRAGVEGKIALVAHCMGGAIVTQGLVMGVIPLDDVENVVITGLGLFYRAALDNLLKVEDRVLEQLLADGQALLHPRKRWDPGTVCVREPGDDPHPWDPLLEEPYKLWLDTPLPHACRIDFCHRISYMFGMPYRPDDIGTIHDSMLASLFGYIPVQMLLHCAQNMRRGHAGRFVESKGEPSLSADEGYLQHDAFRGRALTLITGDVNSLWHRDSIDTMDEWLRRGPRSERPRALHKHVFAGYGHQDLYWATGAPETVFPCIRDGLRL
jgi:pimeloyl-ACP methyl ester carboxylesterase